MPAISTALNPLLDPSLYPQDYQTTTHGGSQAPLNLGGPPQPPQPAQAGPAPGWLNDQGFREWYRQQMGANAKWAPNDPAWVAAVNDQMSDMYSQYREQQTPTPPPQQYEPPPSPPPTYGGGGGYGGGHNVPAGGGGEYSTQLLDLVGRPGPFDVPAGAQVNYPGYRAPDPFTYDPFAAPTQEQAAAEPGYDFALRQGQRMLEHSAAAQGLARSGGHLAGLIDYGQSLGQQNYQNVYNRALSEYELNRANAADIYAQDYRRNLDQYLLGYNRELTRANRVYDQAYDAYRLGLDVRGQDLGALTSDRSLTLGSVESERANRLAQQQLQANILSSLYNASLASLPSYTPTAPTYGTGGAGFPYSAMPASRSGLAQESFGPLRVGAQAGGPLGVQAPGVVRSGQSIYANPFEDYQGFG